MGILDLLFPKQCFNCNRSGNYLCANCINLLPIVKQKCIVCEKSAIDGFTHDKCRGKYTIDRTISLWNYSGGVRKALISLKYKFAKEIADELSMHVVNVSQNPQISLTTLNPLTSQTPILIPIPMHWHRKNWRGFNQVEEVGRKLSIGLGFRYESNMLIRSEKRQAQVTLNEEQRIKNIEGVFSLNPYYELKTINNELFILFDDVYTTGATLKEAGKVLKKAGAKNVWALTIAR